ncbi:hypothetical protein NN561_009939 [Cricetulus griseus]
MQIRSRVNSLRTLCKKGQVASDAHRGSVPNPPPLPRSIGTASFSRPPKAISPEVGSSDSRGQDPNSPTNSSRYFGKSTACKGGARVSANRNCRSRLHQALVSVLPPAPIVKSEASCRVDVLALWPVPSTEICGHLACFGPVCSSAQCRAPRPVGCAPSWKPMGAPWVHRLRLLPQLGPPTLFNSLVGAHCPGRGCLDFKGNGDVRVLATWFAGPAASVSGTLDAIQMAHLGLLFAEITAWVSPSCQTDGPWCS